MKIAPDSATRAAAEPATLAADSADGAAGFDALLASLLLPSPEVPALPVDLAPSAGAAVTVDPEHTTMAAGTEASVQSLLATLQASQSLGLAMPGALPGAGEAPAATATERRPSAADAAAVAADRLAPGKVAVDDRLAEKREAARLSAGLHAMGGDAGEAKPPTLPPLPASPAAQRSAERDAAGPTVPTAFAAAHAGTLAATELPPRQAVLPVAPPVSSPAWQQAFGEQVLWTARAEFQSASLTLNPPDLGPVSIELALNDGQASASFSSQQPEVRKAIEDALPLLKQMFADAGLQLEHADVGSGRQQQPARDPQSSSAAGSPQAEPEPAHALPVPQERSSALLDTYA